VAAAWAALFACLLLTFSRSGLLAAVLGMTVAAIWLSRTGTLAGPVTGLVLKVAAAAAVMIAVFGYAFNRYLATRLMETLLGSDPRVVWMNVAMNLIAEHPIAGVGAGNFSLATRAATSGRTTHDAVHNIPLLIEAELGLLGLAAMGTIATVLIAVGYRRWRARSVCRWHALVAGSLMAMVTVSLFDHYLWTHPQGGLMGAWLVGWWLTDDAEDASSARSNATARGDVSLRAAGRPAPSAGATRSGTA
jgi:O-antigen ligase